MPVCMLRPGRPGAGPISAISRSTAACSSSAAATARRGSSRRASGTPKRAMISSPTNWLTVPPWRSITAVASALMRPMIASTSSGSVASFRAV